MFRIYLDGILLNDIPKGLETPELMIVREDGFQSSDQILREKTEMQLEFYGDGFNYLCSLKKNNRCALVDVLIEKKCTGGYESFFDGIIAVSDIQFDLTRCTTKQTLKDNSFTGLIKDYSKTQVALWNTSTKNCELLNIETLFIFFQTDPNNYATSIQRKGFDALSVLQYIISYVTDNKIQVVSNYLTTYKYAVTTGYNLHNNTGALDKVFPGFTYSDFFTQIRKKLRLYMVIEYSGGQPYLRIEHESYAYDATTQIFNLTDIPFGAVESFDKTRLFNSIEVGSDTTKLQDGSTDYYAPSDSTQSWDKRTYNACGECTVQADSEQNKLDLVSSYIIDSDVIVEALNQPPTDSTNQYNNDEAIFLIRYGYDPTFPRADLTLDTATGQHIYNAVLSNENVINNWLGYSPQCIATSRYSRYGFEGYRPTTGVTFIFGLLGGQSCYFRREFFLPEEVVYDTGASFTNEVYTLGSPCAGQSAGPYTTKVFHCTENGSYDFHGSISNIQQTDGSFGYHMIYTLSIVVYSDNTFTTELNRFDTIKTVNESKNEGIGLDVQTGMVAIAIGNVVVLEYNLQVDPTQEGAVVETVYFEKSNTIFQLTNDNFTCDNLNDTEQDSKPVKLEFESLLCYSDYKNIRENKRGYIAIKGKKFYLKELTYKETGISRFILIGNDSLCGC